jgi:hypothetical protein
MKIRITIFFALLVTLVSCHQTFEHKTVICIPVYGQSLALGEEATRITDFDSLAAYANGRIVTENLDHNFGYFDNDDLKHFAKKMVGYQKRAFELTIYSMAKMLADSTGTDTLICTFPGGQGATTIDHLGKGTKPYQEFLEDIQTAYEEAQDRGWDFVMPALCWMQGETDITDYPGTDYMQLFLQLVEDINNDVKIITGQKQDIEIICYQTGPLARAKNFNALAYNCPEMTIPQAFLELVRDNPRYHASGPMYPYTFVREAIHIDGIGHQQHGRLVALSALDILHHKKQPRGLIPIKVESQGEEVIVDFNTPWPPLNIDTTQVVKAENYGFSVITPDNRNIAQSVFIQDNKIHILCSAIPDSCRVRYAVNGEKMKSGRQHGPRGNLRDSQGDSLTINIQGRNYPIHNWCWQFDIPITDGLQ